MAALASCRKGLSARKKIIENGSLQLEIYSCVEYNVLLKLGTHILDPYFCYEPHE